jgi:hypothetical protein
MFFKEGRERRRRKIRRGAPASPLK